MIKLAIFDFDGVVADTLAATLKAANRILQEEGREERVSASDVRAQGIRKIISRLKVPLYKVPFYAHKLRKYASSDTGNALPFPKIRRVLLKLKRGHKLALVTSNSRQNVNFFLGKNSMHSIFDLVVGGASLFGKSSKIRRAIKAFGVKKDEAVMVGDEIRDIEAARKLGLRIICVTWGFNSGNMLKRHLPDYLISEPESLPKVLKSIAKQKV